MMMPYMLAMPAMLTALTALTAFDAHIDLSSLLWLFPIVFMFHDFEEIITVEKWAKANEEKVKNLAPAALWNFLADSFKMNTLHFSKDVLWVYSTIVISTILAVFFSFYYLFLMALFLFFIHSFTHLGQAALLKSYTPGVLTTPLLVLPYSIYAYYRLLGDGIVSISDIVISSSLMLIILPTLLILLKKERAKYANPR